MTRRGDKVSSREADRELIFQNIIEWLNDENKVITYRWLSLTLGLHVNYAKQLMELFVNAERAKGRSLSVTYCITGLASGDGMQGYRVAVVKEDCRDSVESTFNSPVSCHVYSIQAGPPLKNSDVLYMADVDVIKSAGYNVNQYSSVQCQHVKLRSANPPAVAAVSGNSSSVKNTLQMTKTSVQKPETMHQPAAKSVADTSSDKNVAELSKQPEKSSPVTAAVSKSNAGFNRLFSGAASKPKTQPSAASIKSPTSSVAQKTNGDNAASAGGKNSALSTSTKQTVSSAAANKTAATKSSRDAPSVSAAVKKSDSAKTNGKNSTQQASKGSSKRRRIVVDSSSSSEDEDMIPPSPPPIDEPELPPSPEPTEQPPSPAAEQTGQDTSSNTGPMQRKLVQKTYINDEGFMVTEKVWVTEPSKNGESDNGVGQVREPSAGSTTAKTAAEISSASAKSSSLTAPSSTETGSHKKQPQKPSTTGHGGKAEKKEKVAPPASKKQASLTNFFQKK